MPCLPARRAPRASRSTTRAWARGPRVPTGLACVLACALLACASETSPDAAVIAAADDAHLAPSRAALQGPQADIAALCELACADRGVLEGSPAISGVAGPDALFAAAIAYARGADTLAAAIETELAAIGADLGVSGKLDVEIPALATLYASAFQARAGQPVCPVDAAAWFEALTRCDSTLDRDSATLSCAGVCRLADADGSCPSGSDRRCAQASAGSCSDGSCRGHCTIAVSSESCQGECFGSCSEPCPQLAADGSCAGPCAGTCQGQCRLTLFDAQACEGRCDGECVVADEACVGLYGECVTPQSGEAVSCQGVCQGEPSTDAGSLECRLYAKLDAALSSSCRSAGARITAVAATAPEDAAAQARFLTSLRNLERRLPQLLMLAEQGERLLGVGDDLRQATTQEALPKSLQKQNQGDVHTRAAVGLECAQAQLMSLQKLVDDAAPRLSASLDAVDELRRGLGLGVP